MIEIDIWLQQNFVSEKTKATYRTALTKFHNRFGEIHTPEELEGALKQWIAELRSQYTPKTVNNYVTAVISFYRDKGVTLDPENWRRIKRRLLPPAKASTFDKAGTHEEWKKILSHMSIKGRSLFLFLLSSGCRIGEALQLKISDLDLDADPPWAYIRPEYTKGGFGGRIVFFTYEARDAIREYLNTKFLLNKRVPKRVYIPKQKRFIAYKHVDDNRVWDITPQTAEAMLWDCLRKAGLDERDPTTGRRLIHVHSTRKFFRSNCGLPDALVHALMGHEGYLDNSYLRTDPQRAGEEYKAVAIPRLTIFERTTTTDKIEILKLVARSLEVPKEQVDAVIQEYKSKGFYEIATAIGKLIKQELSKGKPKYHIVEESEVQAYLLEGWDVVKVLNDGRFLLART